MSRHQWLGVMMSVLLKQILRANRPKAGQIVVF
jgi:hypothetical protein